MEWLNIHSSTLDSEAFLDASPAQQSTWLRAFRYCAGQENGGCIRSCETWTDRKWQQVARVTLKEIKSNCQLWGFKNGDFNLKFYPVEKETEIQAKRLGGSLGQKKLAAKLAAQPGRKGREGKGSGSETEAPTNRVSIQEAVLYFKKIGSDYSDEDIRSAWNTFEATAVEGVWMFGQRQVGDWRAALEARLASNRVFQKKNGAAVAEVSGSLKRERGEILQELGIARSAGDENRILDLQREIAEL